MKEEDNMRTAVGMAVMALLLIGGGVSAEAADKGMDQKGQMSDHIRGVSIADSYVAYLKSLKNFETTFNDNGAGVAISFKKSEK